MLRTSTSATADRSCKDTSMSPSCATSSSATAYPTPSPSAGYNASCSATRPPPSASKKFYDALKSQGLPVSKDSLHAFLAYFEDAFLIRTTSLLTASERQRMVNPRKAYPIDSGLIPIYESVGRDNLGHSLETAVFIELLRRGNEVHYFRTPEGNEIDFHAVDAAGNTQLIQVCANASDPATLHREVRSLVEAKARHPEMRTLLILLDPLPPGTTVPDAIDLTLAIPWFLRPTDH